MSDSLGGSPPPNTPGFTDHSLLVYCYQYKTRLGPVKMYVYGGPRPHRRHTLIGSSSRGIMYVWQVLLPFSVPEREVPLAPVTLVLCIRRALG